MGLIITGVVKAVRSEVQITSLHRQALLSMTQADAAILLALQNLQAKKTEPLSTIQVIPVQFEGIVSQVTATPLNGLIDINNASIPLLVELYRHAGGLSPTAAQTLAQATVEFRQLKSAKGTAQGFDAIEDLLRVSTMTYSLYAKINLLVTADLKEGSGRVNPLAAPLGVLEVLTAGDTSRAAILASKRSAESKLMDTSFLKPEHIEMASSLSLRLQISLALPNGGYSQKAWNIYWDADPRSGLPWRVLGKQQLILTSNQVNH